MYPQSDDVFVIVIVFVLVRNLPTAFPNDNVVVGENAGRNVLKAGAVEFMALQNVSNNDNMICHDK
jgi:hypothetical protein